MPSTPKVICGNGCYALVEKGTKCPKHQKQRHASKNRPGDKFYASAAWRKLRAAKLRDSPLCECDDCKSSGAVTAADTVDHIKPRREFPELEYETTNLRAMSAAHHNRRTARDRMRKRGA
jgi:5-methylcytosine-specific restriction enzyme A